MPQPSALSEDIKQKVVDRVSIKGVTHRYWEAQKKSVVMTFSTINNTQWLQLMSYFANQGAAVTYSNSVSGFTFTGFATTAAAEFIPGNSFLRNMDVTLVET